VSIIELAPNTIMCSATRASPAALEWLETNTPSRPYHIFETVCNLINAEEDVLSLTLAPAEMNPLSFEMLCGDLSLDLTKHIQVNSEVLKDGAQLCVGNLIIDLEPHDPWNPSPDWGRVTVRMQETQSVVDEITAILLSDHSPDSLAIFLSPSGFESKTQPSSWQRAAIIPIQMLLDGIERLDSSALHGAASDLAGLGLGLTPSGDDFIIGVMHALWMILSEEQARSLCRELLTATTPRTNALSANYLKAAAHGEASEAWHTIVSAIAQNDKIALNSSVEILKKLGHTSGQDALSGFLLGSRHIQRSSFCL